MFYCIDNLHVLSVLWSLLTRFKMNILITVRFFHNLKGWSTWPNALESDGPYYEIMGQ